jgi:hypothetical protein
MSVFVLCHKTSGITNHDFIFLGVSSETTAAEYKEVWYNGKVPKWYSIILVVTIEILLYTEGI